MVTTVAVTGGTGFVGRHVIRALKRDGYRVLDIGRRRSEEGADEYVPVELSAGASRAPRLGNLPLVHCAAEVQDGFDRTMLRRNTLIMESALALTSGRFVHVSSSSVYDIARPSVHTRESAATGQYRWFNTYGHAKFLNEQQLLTSGRESAFILRPHAVYGDGDTTLLPRVLRATRGAVLPLPLRGRALHALTWVENFAAAVTAALKADTAGIHPLNITDGESLPIAEAFQAVAGKAMPVLHIPMRTARHVAIATRGRFGISPYSVRQLGFERTYDLSRSRELLDWSPVRGTLARLQALSQPTS